jgi:hypothetical protein
VEQNETFAELIEKATGMRTLNAAISSYGTAREMRLLERLDISNLQYLIIQYSDNDYHENSVLHNEGDLDITSREKRQRVIEKNSARAEYYIGKYSVTAFWYTLNYMRGTKMFSSGQDSDVLANNEEHQFNEVDSFINAIKSTKLDLTNVKIFIFEINGYNKNDSDFIGVLKDRIANNRDIKKLAQQVIVLDISPILTDKEYYYFDDHINASGHQTIADYLVDYIATE